MNGKGSNQFLQWDMMNSAAEKAEVNKDYYAWYCCDIHTSQSEMEFYFSLCLPLGETSMKKIGMA